MADVEEEEAAEEQEVSELLGDAGLWLESRERPESESSSSSSWDAWAWLKPSSMARSNKLISSSMDSSSRVLKGSGRMGVDVTLLLELFMCGGRKIPVRLVAPNVELMLVELLEERLSMGVLGGTLTVSNWGPKIWGKSWLQLGSEAWWRLTSWLIGVGRGASPKLPVVLESLASDVPLTLLESVWSEVLFTSIAFGTRTLC